MTRSRYDYGSEGTATQNFIPDTDNAYDLGSSSYEWKDLYLDGVAYLDKLEISPQGATVPTASSLAIQDNSASGNIVYVRSEPGTGTATTELLKLEALGSSGWGSSYMLRLTKEDNSTNYIYCHSGSVKRFAVDSSANVYLDGALNFYGAGSITTASNGNLTLLPNGSGITIIGDAGSTSHSLAANDDCLITGKCEVDGSAYFDGSVSMYSTVNCTNYLQLYGGAMRIMSGSGATQGYTEEKMVTELITIPVGSGLDPVVVSSVSLAPANSIILSVAAYVTQAPGGGASTLDIGRTNGGNLDEFVDGMSTAITTSANHIANNDGNLTAEDMWNASADTFTLTTDADVTTSDMKVRITVTYKQLVAASA